MKKKKCINCEYKVEWEEGDKPERCPNCGVYFWDRDTYPKTWKNTNIEVDMDKNKK